MFVLTGEITDGAIKVGMSIKLVDQANGERPYAVVGVELVNYGRPRPSGEVGICVRYTSDEQLKVLLNMGVNGKSFDVT